MNGFSVEPGERTILVMSIQPERLASKKSAEPTSPRMSPVRASAITMATERRGPSLAAASLATCSSPSWTLLRIVSCSGLPACGLRSMAYGSVSGERRQGAAQARDIVQGGARGLAFAEQA